MRLGPLREVVTLQRPHDTAGTGISVSRAWTDVAEVRAQVTQPRGSESPDPAPADVLTYQVRMRYRSDITPAWRVVWGGKTLDITDVVDPDGRRSALLITAEWRHGG